MLKKLAWLFSFCALTGLVLVYHFYVRPLDVSGGFLFMTDLLSYFLTTIILSLLVGLLLALIPVKNKTYGKRYIHFLPLSIIFISSLYIILFLATAPHYYRLPQNKSLSCACVRDGVFTGRNLKIERKGNVQYQTDTRKGIREELIVNWLTDCEYELIHKNVSMKVKIVSADSSGYECYTLSRGFTSPKQKITRLKE